SQTTFEFSVAILFYLVINNNVERIGMPCVGCVVHATDLLPLLLIDFREISVSVHNRVDLGYMDERGVGHGEFVYFSATYDEALFFGVLPRDFQRGLDPM